MYKSFLPFMLILVFSISGKANTTESDLKEGSVTGKVIDKAQNQPVPYAAIVIKNQDGSSTITGGITREDGSFEVKDLPEGHLLLEVQFIGYKTYSEKIFLSKGQWKLDLGVISLEESSQQLSEVEVVGERTTIEQKIDRKVINVGRDLTTAGATASDIMNNIASLSVDQQTGQLSLRGNSNVRVMVDGKMSNVPVAQLLKQIPSTSIKSIELITNPSAKYNPEGMSGIINIILYKNANIGFNGNINTGLTMGKEAKFNSSLDMNYRNGKFNFYGSAGTIIGKYEMNGTLQRPDVNSEQQMSFNNNNKSYLYKLGLDFYLNDNNTISFFTNQNSFNGKGSGITDVIYYDEASRNSTQYFNNFNDNLSPQYNFDYKHEFNKEGHNIELEVDYNKFTDDEDAWFRTTGNILFPDYRDMAATERTQTTTNLDYVIPIDSITKVEAGLEARSFETDVDYSSTGLTYNNQGVLRPTPSSQFLYGMDIYSAYTTFGQKYTKWAYQIGLRLEDVKVKADTNNVRSFTDNYTELYPSGFITYTPTEKNQLQLSFSRRVDRPGLNQVNPIREWSTPLVSSLGNPELLPQFTNSYELNYTRRLEKGSVTAGVFYRSIKDEINRAVLVDRLDLNKLILTYNNYDATNAFGVEASANYNPFNWWSINGSFDMYSQIQRGITESLQTTDPNPTDDDIVEQEVEVKNLSWNLRVNNTFTATKNITFQLFGLYRGANEGIQFKINPMYFVNAGARYSFAQGKGAFSLNFNDIFNTMKFSFDAERPYTQIGRFNGESRTVYIGLSYQFGSGKNKAANRKSRDNDTKQSGGGGIL